jgi:sec-independent protein translocase protein TatB
MDSIFGIGLPELMVILLLAGLFMGPHRIRRVARTLGYWTAQLQTISRQFARQLNTELDSLDSGEMKGALQDVRDLQREVEALRGELGQASRSVIQEGEGALKDGEEAMKEAGETPKGATTPNKNGSPEVNTDAESGSEESALPRLLEVPDDPEI